MNLDAVTIGWFVIAGVHALILARGLAGIDLLQGLVAWHRLTANMMNSAVNATRPVMRPGIGFVGFRLISSGAS